MTYTSAELGGLNIGATATGEQISEDSRGPKSPLVRVGGRIDLNETRELVLASQKQSEDEQKDLRLLWDELYGHMRMRVPRAKKKDWQADVYLPELQPVVKKGASNATSILMKSDSYFSLEADERFPKELLKGMEAIVRYHHEQPIKRDEAGRYHRKAGVFNLFQEAIESEFALGVSAIKTSWTPRTKKYPQFVPGGWGGVGRSGGQSYEEPGFDLIEQASTGLYGRIVDPRRLWWDDAQSYIIEERIITVPELSAGVESKTYDGNMVAKLQKQDYGDDEEMRAWMESKGLYVASSAFRRRCHLYEYWGPILDSNGKEVAKNRRIVLGNKQWIINPSATKNPFWHGQNPYIISNPNKLLFRSTGMSLIEGALSLQKAINDIANMTLDGLKLKLLRPLWFIADRILNKEKLKELKPLQLLAFKRGEGMPIGEVPLSDIPEGALQQIEVLRRALQNSTMLSDLQMAVSQKRDITATEASIQSNASQGFYSTLSRSIEEELIEPYVERTIWLALQFWDDFSDPVLQQISAQYGLPLGAPDRATRVSFLAQQVRVQSRGISSFFDKIGERQELFNLIQTLMSEPGFLMRMDRREVVRRLLETYMLSGVDKMIIPEDKDQMLSQLEWAKIMQTMAPAQPQQPQGGQDPFAQAGLDPNDPQAQAALQLVMSGGGLA
jgi:hypothetical protein